MGRIAPHVETIKLVAITLATKLALFFGMRNGMAPQTGDECEHKACSKTGGECGPPLINHTCCWQDKSCTLISCVLSECPPT